MKHIIPALFLTAFISAIPVFAQTEDTGNGISFAPLAAYTYIHLEEQAAHTPLFGLAVMAGDYGNPFTEIHKSFFAAALYQPVFFSNGGMNATYHKIDLLLDGRIKRHNVFGLLHAPSDKPIAGGLHTFYAGAAYGYEIIRRDTVSFILGATLAIGDFDVDLPNGDPLPVFPMPFIRLSVDTRWFDMGFEYMLGPSLTFVIAPESRIRFTADMHMEITGAWKILRACGRCGTAFFQKIPNWATSPELEPA
jgi:hypothetical protein